MLTQFHCYKGIINHKNNLNFILAFISTQYFLLKKKNLTTMMSITKTQVI